MSVNSSSFPANHVPRPPNSSNFSYILDCQQSVASNVIYSMFTFTSVLFLLPLYILILYMGFQRWRRQASAASGQTNSHSDFITYHMVTMEIFGVAGALMYTLSIYTKSTTMLNLGLFFSFLVYPGQTLFHCLTCVERYLAVVHPISYMQLRETGGVRIRNTCIVCVWLLCVVWLGITQLYWPNFPLVPFICMTAGAVVVILYCCLSVIWVLTHPGPGEVGGDKERVDQSKKRAFHIILAIAGVLLLRCLGLMVSMPLQNVQMRPEDVCAVVDFGACLTLPSSLVLPLLFLHKTGKLACCRSRTEPG